MDICKSQHVSCVVCVYVCVGGWGKVSQEFVLRQNRAELLSSAHSSLERNENSQPDNRTMYIEFKFT